MCQLLGFCSEKPVGFSAVFREFRKRAESNPHAWGIALWNGNDECGPAVIREPRPANKSRLAGLLCNNVLPGKVLIAHVRYGTTRGEDSLRTVTNTHPFVANIGGRDWAFAHNGYVSVVGPVTAGYSPHGTTDSERVFTILVDSLRGVTSRDGKIQAIKKAIEKCSGRGKLNFLLSDGKTLFFFSNMGCGLHYRELSLCRKNGQVVMVATEPVGAGSCWKRCEAGVLYVAEDGRIVREDVTTVQLYIPKPKVKVKEPLPALPRPAGSFEEDLSDWDLWNLYHATSQQKPARHRSYIDYWENEVRKQ